MLIRVARSLCFGWLLLTDHDTCNAIIRHINPEHFRTGEAR